MEFNNLNDKEKNSLNTNKQTNKQNYFSSKGYNPIKDNTISYTIKKVYPPIIEFDNKTRFQLFCYDCDNKLKYTFEPYKEEEDDKYIINENNK